MTCPFCDMTLERVIAGNMAAFAVRDLYLVNEGHTLVISRRHVADYFDLADDVLRACPSSCRFKHIRVQYRGECGRGCPP